MRHFYIKEKLLEDIEFVEIHNYLNLDNAEERKNRNLYFAFRERFSSYLYVSSNDLATRYIKNNVVYQFADISIEELLALIYDSLILNEDLILKAWRCTQ